MASHNSILSRRNPTFFYLGRKCIKIKDLKRETIMNLYRADKSLDEIQIVMHMAFPD